MHHVPYHNSKCYVIILVLQDTLGHTHVSGILYNNILCYKLGNNMTTLIYGKWIGIYIYI